MEITTGMIEEVKNISARDSLSFTKLSFYQQLMSSIDKEYTNDELEPLKYILTELGRNIAYELIRERTSTKYSVDVELTKKDRMNNIHFRIVQIDFLMLSNGSHKYISSNTDRNYIKFLPFYKKNPEMAKEIYDELEKLDSIYHIVNKDEAIGKIAEYTGCYMQGSES